MHAPPSQQYQQQAPVTPQDNPYQRRSSSARKPEGQNPYPAVERREPIRPRESAGGIIYGGGSVRDSNNGDKPSSSYALVTGLAYCRKRTRRPLLLGMGTTISRRRRTGRLWLSSRFPSNKVSSKRIPTSLVLIQAKSATSLGDSINLQFCQSFRQFLPEIPLMKLICTGFFSF